MVIVQNYFNLAGSLDSTNFQGLGNFVEVIVVVVGWSLVRNFVDLFGPNNKVGFGRNFEGYIVEGIKILGLDRIVVDEEFVSWSLLVVAMDFQKVFGKHYFMEGELNKDCFVKGELNKDCFVRVELNMGYFEEETQDWKLILEELANKNFGPNIN